MKPIFLSLDIHPLQHFAGRCRCTAEGSCVPAHSRRAFVRQAGCENPKPQPTLARALALTLTRCRSFTQPRGPATRSNCASSCERTPKTLITEHPTVRHPCTKRRPKGTRDACTCCSQATRLSTSPTQAGRRRSCPPSTTATLSSWRCVPVPRAFYPSLPPPLLCFFLSLFSSTAPQ